MWLGVSAALNRVSKVRISVLNKIVGIQHHTGTYQFSFTFLSRIKFANHSSGKRQCLSCEFLDPSTLTWESRGCYVVSVDRIGVTCKCNHTTNFAAFMMPVEMEFIVSNSVTEVS